MKKIERTRERIFIEHETISTINGLDNAQMILIERGDAIRKAAKKAKSASKYELCCVCTEFVAVNTLDNRGVCRSCQIAM